MGLNLFLKRKNRCVLAVGLDALVDHQLEQVAHAVAVAPLVVVPADQLEEAVVQLHAGALVEDA